ncbi:hypothetical protein DDB_G0283777 [Dictyostelium discoideum AX4]|uniref:Uncharacterized protein n=1 Tax=Dictyostelium discoideum TaxID=44689 RepID=Q54QL6_DICDI|nr:hypothetical protein DDB_G0283777 [Dictyostelium discoideum AX4]EAL65503.1 hypothetical protein DDB_G0283777 [Dictyostelium discoideum AX4]|eukprot:XP_638855.1 hypothetical protein DDB_G0283777 [Dictyostelium discoideum AX4]
MNYSTISQEEFNVQVARHFDLITSDSRARITPQIKESLKEISQRINPTSSTNNEEWDSYKSELVTLFGDYIKSNNIAESKYF